MSIVGDKSFPEQVPIDEYGDLGFRFKHLSHRGSILSLPSGIYAWKVNNISELSAASFAPVFAEAEKIDIFYLGLANIIPLKNEIRRNFAKNNIVIEAINLGSAISTYNILLSEKRQVAAGFIVPKID